ncbi:hypothetical protein PRZ48_007454 [Zasmidium cellare]|uniref:Uncharacterized protein n=1 Tax=Zasmidium cellare TaxID=395010 RepID=A0ABR0EKD7_ZASCE|nr:hypothetical protein PRZ48_007454 [Zasmidium cellare]
MHFQLPALLLGLASLAFAQESEIDFAGDVPILTNPSSPNANKTPPAPPQSTPRPNVLGTYKREGGAYHKIGNGLVQVDGTYKRNIVLTDML